VINSFKIWCNKNEIGIVLKWRLAVVPIIKREMLMDVHNVNSLHKILSRNWHTVSLNFQKDGILLYKSRNRRCLCFFFYVI